MGFEAASDHCSTHISYSCILAAGTRREDLVDAMRKRHAYGATDNIVLDFRVEADGREYLQGDEIPSADALCAARQRHRHRADPPRGRDP